MLRRGSLWGGAELGGPVMVQVGQTFIIAAAVLLHNLVELAGHAGASAAAAPPPPSLFVLHVGDGAGAATIQAHRE